MLIPWKKIKFFDWIQFFLTFSLVIIGIIFIYSATYTETRPFSLFFKKQCVGAFIGLFIYFFFAFVPLSFLMTYGQYCFLLTLFFLCYTTVAGRWAKGGKRWISLYFFRFQPSDLARLFFPAFSVRFFDDPHKMIFSRYTLSDLRVPIGALGVCFFLIARQPDLGSALLVGIPGALLLWIGGLNKRTILSCIILGIIGMPLFWSMLKPYQKGRIMVMLGYGDIKKERYQLEQSKIAIGSGGVLGKGFMQGTQNKLQFLPEDHTDFIFAVICEECGLLGACFLFLLFILLCARILFITLHVPLFQYQLVALGLLLPIMLSVIVNCGMVMGCLPVVGIPLPLVSYGLTNLWITLACLGWINNIAMHRYYH